MLLIMCGTRLYSIELTKLLFQKLLLDSSFLELRFKRTYR